MGLDIASMGQDAAGKAVDGIMGLVVGKHNDRRQLKQQEKLQAQQIKGMKEMSDYQQAQQMDMWNKTNYGAQAAHMDKAGLNVGLMYGMGGGGGATTGSASGGGVSGGSAQGSANEIQNQMSMGLMMAQKRNIEAQTAKTEEETKDIAGVDRDKKNVGLEQQQIDLQIRQGVGVDRYVRRGMMELEGMNAKDAKQVREFESWMETMYDADSMTINVDGYGSYGTSENDFIRKVMKAGGEELLEKVNNLRKTGVTLNDQHELNELEKEIKGFRADLSALGLNEQTTALLGVILGAGFGILSKGRMKTPETSTTVTGHTTRYGKNGKEKGGTVHSTTTNRINLPKKKK